ncbi:MAG: GNVR domain-containing protein, partial [Salinimicrobium sediminis]|nr:GNVR domain-containing protein [Salinimicrobium sediminis]
MAHEDDHISDVGSTFDFKGFVLKVFSYWQLILISIAISLGVAYYNNVRKLPVYRLGNSISIKDDQNPFFTSNTSLTFNWGGTSDKVNTAMTILNSRSHNEEVVERLQYYIGYQQDGEYQRVNAYGFTPFIVVADTAAYQAQGNTFTIRFKDPETFTLSTNFSGGSASVFNYRTKEYSTVVVEDGEFQREYKLNDHIDLPFFSGTLIPTQIDPVIDKPFYVQFKHFDGTVGRWKGVSVSPQSQGASVLNLSLTGDNKAEIVDYLNGTVRVLSQNMLERKNLFATKTIRFIDSSLNVKAMELQVVEDELNNFRNKNSILDISAESSELNSKLSALDVRKENIARQLAYYETLQDYLQTRSDYSDVPAPSVAGIAEGSIVSGVGRILALAEERRKYEYSLQENSPVFKDIDRQINAVKDVLLENMASSQGLLRDELRDINRDIAMAEGEIRKLPQEEQDLLKIQRKYSISERTYNLFLEKRSEAGLIKAANVSDVMVIDTAKDTGGGQIGPNTQLNYVMALMVGGMIPLTFVFLLVFMNTNVHNAQEVTRLSPIPILGMIGRSRMDTNLAVFQKPKSAIAEGFRGLRSSLQFMY